MIDKAGWPEYVEVKLHGFGQGGVAVGRWEGRPVFATGGLPGEMVVVRLTERSKSQARGIVTEVLAPSPERAEPQCPLYGQCGGCNFQHLTYSTQLAGKEEILRDQLRYMGRIQNPQVLPTVASSPWSYRSSARIQIKDRQLGYYAAGSRELVPLEACPLLHPLLNDAIARLQPLLPIAGLKDVRLRVSVAERRAAAVLSGTDLGRLSAAAREWRKSTPALAGVVAEAGKQQFVDGDPLLHEVLGGVRLRVSPESFFQANVEVAGLLLEALRPALNLQPGERLLDAYCGVGTFVLPLSDGAQLSRTLGIEESPQAIEDAKVSARRAGITATEFIAARVERLLPEIAAQEQFDAVLLDPPRRGVEPEVLRALLALRPRRIAYISCHPGTLARDLRSLIEGGYQLRFSQPFDFFPQTGHVESLNLLDWAGA